MGSVCTFLALVPIYTVEVLTFFKPTLWPLSILVSVSYVVIPISVFIAVTHYNLFDIDRLISATVAYTVVSVIVSTGASIILPTASHAATRILGLDSVAGQLVVTLLVAIVVVQGSPRLRPQIERFFFAERFALERGVEHLLRNLSTCEGPREVLALVGERLDYFLRPECCAVYGRSGETYSPLFFGDARWPPRSMLHLNSLAPSDWRTTRLRLTDGCASGHLHFRPVIARCSRVWGRPYFCQYTKATQ